MPDIFTSLGYKSSPPRNLSYSHKIQKVAKKVQVDLTWNIPELTHGSIRHYMVEYYSNDASVATRTDRIMVCMYIILIKYTLVRVQTHIYGRQGIYGIATGLKIIYVTEFGKTVPVCTRMEIYFIAYYTIAIDKKVCFYRQLFANSIKPRRTNIGPMGPLGCINRVACGSKLFHSMFALLMV